MIRHIINSVPVWWLMALIILAFMSMTYTASLLSALCFKKPTTQKHREYANAMIGILGGGFYILLALTIVNAWNYQIKIQDALFKEVHTLALIQLQTAELPSAFKTKLHALLNRYKKAVQAYEWEAMREGRNSQLAWHAFYRLYAEIQNQRFQARNPSSYQNLLSAANALFEAREHRLRGVDSVIPNQLRIALILGSVFLTVMLGAIREDRHLFGVFPALSFAALLGFNLTLALSLDYPYSGELSIQYYLKDHDLFQPYPSGF